MTSDGQAVSDYT